MILRNLSIILKQILILVQMVMLYHLIQSSRKTAILLENINAMIMRIAQTDQCVQNQKLVEVSIDRHHMMN